MIIDGEKSDKTPFHDDNSTRNRRKLNLIKSICAKLTANNILNDEQQKVFPIRSGTRQDIPFDHFYST